MGNNPVNYVDPTGHCAKGVDVLCADSLNASGGGAGWVVFLSALAGGAVKGTWYAAAHPFDEYDPEKWWAGLGQAIASGEVGFASYAISPGGAAAGSAIGLLTGMLSGEATAPEGFDPDSKDEWYSLFDAAVGYDTILGVPGVATVYGVTLDAALADKVLASIDYGSTYWRALTTQGKALMITMGLLATNAFKPMEDGSSGSKPNTKSEN